MGRSPNKAGCGEERMPLAKKTLGDVLLHIYDYDFSGGIYLPDICHYEVDTACIVAWAEGNESWAAVHEACLDQGFTNWLNIAVVSDTCDGVSTQTEACLVAAFNDDCGEGGWLRRMMNYRAPNSTQ
jgi:hypothetical protein